jgi:hypothetical protein
MGDRGIMIVVVALAVQPLSAVAVVRAGCRVRLLFEALTTFVQTKAIRLAPDLSP